MSLEKGKWIDHLPVSNLAENDAITFLAPSTEDCIDLSKTILVVGAKVTKTDSTNLEDDRKVGPVNNFMHALCKQVDVFSNLQYVPIPDQVIWRYRNTFNYGHW